MEENCSPSLCLSFGKAGKMEDLSLNRGNSSLVAIMWDTLKLSDHNFFFKSKVGRKWIGATVVIQARRYKRDPHDWCPFPHYYSNSHGCNRLNWAIDFTLAASFTPKNQSRPDLRYTQFFVTKHHMLKDSSYKSSTWPDERTHTICLFFSSWGVKQQDRV